MNFYTRKRLPILLQTEMAECGIACLAMVASYYGHRTDVATLRRTHGVSQRGANLRELMATAAELRMATRPLRLELAQLPKLRCPAILHWNMSHFVVLERASARRIVIHDPAVGRRRYSLAEASSHFTGVALELLPAADFTPAEEVQRMRLRDLWAQASGVGRTLVHLLLLSLLLQLLTLASPLYPQIVVDEVLVKQDADLLTVLAVGFGLVMLIRVGVSALRGWIALYAATSLGHQLGANLFRHLVRLPLEYFERRHLGDIVSRFGSTRQIREMLTEGVISALLDGSMAIITLVMMFVYSPLLATIVLVAVGLFLAFRLIRFPYERAGQEEQVAAAARENTTFMENVRSIPAIKTFGKESQAEHLWQNQYVNVLNVGVRLGRFSLSVDALNQILFGLETILVTYVASRRVMEGAFTIGMFFAFNAYQRQFSTAIISLIGTGIRFRMLDVHLTRLADIAFTPREVGFAGPSKFRREIKGGLSLERVSYRYAPRERWIVKDLSLEIGAGECVVIMGRSGSGKTTLLKLLMGLTAPVEGVVRVDGERLLDYGLENYRAQIAAVIQGDVLMAGSIEENISFFDPLLDRSRVRAAAAGAAILAEIEAMPMKYETLVGDLGANMSYGQRQRVLIARALYANPRVLFLDEATSHIDLQTEQGILERLRAMGITLVVISHRPEVRRLADRVFEVHEGSLIERSLQPVAEDPPEPLQAVSA